MKNSGIPNGLIPAEKFPTEGSDELLHDVSSVLFPVLALAINLIFEK
jgi:hypothetical protein